MYRLSFGLLFVILLIGCKRDAGLVTPTTIAVVSTPNATQFVMLPTETSVPPTTIITAIPSEPATAYPTAAQTPTLTPSPTPIEQFVTPTLPPVTETAGDSDQLYRLKEWSDAEAAALVSLMTDYANGIMADWELYDWYGDQGRQEIIELGREFILRYPNSPYRTEVEWQMVDASTYFPSRELDDLLAKLIEGDLNAGVTSLETLDTYLHPHGLQVSLQECQSCAPFPTAIPNLLGDGREIPLFLIERQTGNIDGAVLMAIWQDTDMEFIVTPILSQWAAFTRFSGGISNFEARHITGDSQPELLIEVWGHSGSIIGISLHMVRWNGEKFVELPGTPLNFSGSFLGDQWEFVEGDDPSRLQVIHAYDNSVTIFKWTGESYERLEITQEDVPPDPADTYAATLWINQGIEQGNYAEVIAYIEEALQKPDSSYSCGTQYECVLRFVLGMNYVYLEDEDMARTVFEALRDGTSPPELTGFSQAAGAFLEHYEGLETAYEACSAAYDVMVATELELSGITELVPLCAFDKLFVEKLSQYDGIGSVFDYVDAVEIIYLQQHDLNGDGRPDWLLALSHPTLFTQTSIEVWAALQMDGGTGVMRLTAIWPRDEEVEAFTAEIYSFPPFGTPMIAILSDNDFILLQLMQGEAGWETKLHRSIRIAMEYSLQLVENNPQLDLFFDATSSGEVDRITYQWDAETKEFVEVNRHAPNSLGVPFSEALDSAEILIFENGDFDAAVTILTAIANEFEPADDFRSGFSFPKALYLLGLAHEIQGNEAEAVAVYWRLWHDYPTNSYALMAAAKLEEK